MANVSLSLRLCGLICLVVYVVLGRAQYSPKPRACQPHHMHAPRACQPCQPCQQATRRCPHTHATYCSMPGSALQLMRGLLAGRCTVVCGLLGSRGTCNWLVNKSVNQPQLLLLHEPWCVSFVAMLGLCCILRVTPQLHHRHTRVLAMPTTQLQATSRNLHRHNKTSIRTYYCMRCSCEITRPLWRYF